MVPRQGRRRRRYGRPMKDRILATDPVPRGFIPAPPPNLPPQTPVESATDNIEMTADEYEAYRLTEYEGLSQEDAAERMGISRGTLWRILQGAKKKLARMIVEGRQLRIRGGNYVVAADRDESEETVDE